MSDWFYSLTRLAGLHVFWLNSNPVVMGLEHARRPGSFILACNHLSPYDVPLLIRHTPRNVDFVSIREVFENRLVGAFYGSMNAFPLDRSKFDPTTTRTIIRRLQAGRVVGMFPEGRLSPGAKSVVHTQQIRTGIGRIAQLANVPIVPAVIIGSENYFSLRAWLPLRRTHYGLIYGEPLSVSESAEQLEAALVTRLCELHETLSQALGRRIESR